MNRAKATYILKVLVLFLVISFIADKIVFITLNKISDNVYTGQTVGKLNHYLKIKDRLDFIVYGSSRANRNVNPLEISKNSFNMGVDGTRLAYATILIKLLDNKQQTVLLHIDPNKAFLSKYDAKDIDALLIKYNRIDTITKEIEALNRNNIAQQFYWSLAYNGSMLGILKNYFKPKYDYKEYSGFDPIHVSKEQKELFKKQRERNLINNECEKPFEINTIYNSLLDQLIVFCNNNNKKLILFSSPKLVDSCPEDNIIFTEILKKKGLVFHDFTNFFDTDFKEEYWKDNSHLSDVGAKVFTKAVKQLVMGN